MFLVILGCYGILNTYIVFTNASFIYKNGTFIYRLQLMKNNFVS